MSKYGELLKGAKGRAPAAPETTPGNLGVAEPPGAASPPEGTPAPPLPRRGRPPGKRSDPSFDQVTAYIPADLYKRVRVRLIEAGDRQEFSELVADLLDKWVGPAR